MNVCIGGGEEYAHVHRDRCDRDHLLNQPYIHSFIHCGLVAEDCRLSDSLAFPFMKENEFIVNETGCHAHCIE